MSVIIFLLIVGILITEFYLLKEVKTQGEKTMADLSALDAAVARVEAAVAEDTALDSSAVTLLDQLAQLIRDNAADQDALNALADRLDAANSAGTGSNAALAEALTRNTPAEPPVDGGTDGQVVSPPVDDQPVDEPPPA